MHGEQVEAATVIAFGAVIWLLGSGRIDVGMSESNKQRMQRGGLLGTAAGLLLLASSYLS